MTKYDVIIVGCGIAGASTAYNLSKLGKKVLVLEQYKVENNLNSSFDLTRLIRYEYGEDVICTQMADKSMKMWHDIEKESDKQLLFPIKSIVIGSKSDDYIKKSLSTLRKLGHKVAELEGESFKTKYPQFNANYCMVDYNAALIEASEGVKAFVDLAKKGEVIVKENSKVISIKDGIVRTFSGEEFEANKIVVVCGGWVKKLLGSNFPVKPIKAQLVYFAPKKGKEHLFTKKNFPAFFFNDSLVYGFPIHGVAAIKIALDERGVLGEIDPDNHNREVEKYYINKIKKLAEDYLPDIDFNNVIATKSCMYTTTTDNHFIIDQVDQKTIVGSFEGHGFKFGPLTGKILANLALDKELPIDISKFRLSRFMQ